MKKAILFTLTTIFFCVIFYACGCSEYSCEASDINIVGAYCNDGTKSDATGAGACSRHGGVKSWRCRKCE